MASDNPAGRFNMGWDAELVECVAQGSGVRRAAWQGLDHPGLKEDLADGTSSS